MQTLKDTYRRSRWVMPGVAVVLGAVFMVAQWIGGHPAAGAVSFAIMAVFAAVLVLLESRSGAVEIMRRPARDERARNIDLAATAFSGIVVITVILVAVMVQLARGEDPSPYAQLGAVSGVAYLVALVGMQRRG
jgi:Kef-type K+ transport system membrane component KefB